MNGGAVKVMLVRILMLSQFGSLHLRRWAMALRDRGHEICVLSLGYSGPRNPVPGITVRRISVPDWSIRRPQRWFGRYGAFIRSVAREERTDLVHVHYLRPHYITRRQLEGRPLVVSVWGSDVMRRLNGESDVDVRQKVALVRQADEVTALSKHLANAVSIYAGGLAKEVRVIYFGVEMERYAWASREGQPRGRRPRVGYVKHMSKIYGPDFLVKAMPEIIRRCGEVDFVMAGDGEMRDELASLANDLGVNQRISWLGLVPHEKVAEVYADCDVFVMPTAEAESFGISAVEAQASGVPVVASDFPGIREAVQDGVTAILIPPREPAAIAEAVVRLLSDSGLRRAMGEAGRSFVRSEFNWSSCVDDMERMYGELLGVEK